MCDYEMPDAYTVTNRLARKPHKCAECRAEIPVGEVYQYLSMVYDGSADSYHTCKTCVAVSKHFNRPTKEHHCGAAIGDLYSTIMESRKFDMRRAEFIDERDCWKPLAIAAAYIHEFNITVTQLERTVRAKAKATT